MRYVKIPKDRVGVLIGPNGETKRSIEKALELQLNIDSDVGEVEVDDRKSSDPLAGLKGENVVRALGRGFAPKKAFRLFSDEVYLHVLDMHDFVGKNKDHVRRVTARVVGSGGRTRKHIEELTGVSISVKGHTVAVLGELESLEVAREALEMLLSGSEHAAAYRFLETKRREARMAEFGF